MGEEIKQDYKKNIFMYLIALLITSILYPLSILNNINLSMLLYWGVYFYQYILFKRLYKKELLLLIGIIILNFILDIFHIEYFRLDIQLAIYFTIVVIYYIFKNSSKCKWQKILAIVLIIPLTMAITFYSRKDKLIKDRGLEKYIKKELYKSRLTEAITISNLEKIRHLYIGSRYNTYTLEGMENLKNLESLRLSDVKGIKNYDVLVSLPNLKKLSLDEGKFDNVLTTGIFMHLEELNLDDFKISSELTNEKFPKLKRLEMHGIDLKDLSFIKELETLEELDLSFCEINSLNGIEKLKKLKKLELYRAKLGDISKIKELEWLEEIDVSKSEVNDIEMLKKSPNTKRLKVN